MKKELYKHDNNLFQSLNWLAFQEGYGRKTVSLNGINGIVMELPFNKRAVWVPKDCPEFPVKKEDLPSGTVFVRVEPIDIKQEAINQHRLRLVSKKSLLSGQASPKATRVLDISKTEEEILSQMKPKTRYNIRLAEKKGVKITPLDSDDVLYEMLEKTAKKGGGFSPHEKSYYTKMVKELSRHDVGHVFVAQHEGDFLAAIFVAFFRGTAIYLHGGQNDLKRNLMAPYLCQWEAIKYAKKHGCQYYDFWGVAETEDPKDPWSGITRFKEGFGGEKVVFPGAYDYVVQLFWYNLLTMLAKIKHLVR